MTYDNPVFQDYHIPGVSHIRATDALDIVRNGLAFLVDVREDEELALGKPMITAGYYHCPLSRFMQAKEQLPEQGTLIFMCAHGIRSIQVAAWFRQQGREDVLNLDGGFAAV
jgi:rhodanese-related sulfurtransferase